MRRAALPRAADNDERDRRMGNDPTHRLGMGSMNANDIEDDIQMHIQGHQHPNFHSTSPNYNVDVIEDEEDDNDDYDDDDDIEYDDYGNENDNENNDDDDDDIINNAVVGLHPHAATRLLHKTTDQHQQNNVKAGSLRRVSFATASGRGESSDGHVVPSNVPSTAPTSTSDVVAAAAAALGPSSDCRVVLVLSVAGGKLAGAYYDATTRDIAVIPDTAIDATLGLVDAVLDQVRPQHIVVSTRADEKLLARLKHYTDVAATRRSTTNDGGISSDDNVNEDDDGDGDDSGILQSTVAVETRPSAEFMLVPARNSLLTAVFEDAELRLGSSVMLASHGRRAKMIEYLGSFIDLEAEGAIACCGALISYLRKTQLTALDERQQLTFHSIRTTKLNAFMRINSDTVRSLQLFVEEPHPSASSSASKEGLSLFGVLDNTGTVFGRNLMHEWFLRPTLDLDTIRQRHEVVSFFVRGENLHYLDQITKTIRLIKNIPPILKKLRTGLALPDWQGMLMFSYYAMKLRAITTEFADSSNASLFSRLTSGISVSVFREIGACIISVIDFDQSKREDRVTVKPGVDQELDRYKEIYHGLDTILSDAAKEISSEVPLNLVNDVNVIYYPQLGYLITIPLQDDMRDKEDFEIEGFQFQFCTAKMVYYKNNKMFELDSTLGDMHSIISDRELEIIQRLQETILQWVPDMENAVALISELDCLTSFAVAATRSQYVCPTITDEENILLIQGGRHPLYELGPDPFVPNDLIVGGGDTPHPSLVLVTGANASGKSVYLKQSALILFMAHLGSFVPATKCIVGLTDMIVARTDTYESVARPQSGFLLDLHQVGNALNTSSKRSLILVDEFGQGTLTSDGIGLFCAMMRSFLKRGNDCPRVLLSTHFHEIVTKGLLRMVVEGIPNIHEIPQTNLQGTLNKPNEPMDTEFTGDSTAEDVVFYNKIDVCTTAIMENKDIEIFDTRADNVLVEEEAEDDDNDDDTGEQEHHTTSHGEHDNDSLWDSISVRGLKRRHSTTSTSSRGQQLQQSSALKPNMNRGGAAPYIGRVFPSRKRHLSGKDSINEVDSFASVGTPDTARHWSHIRTRSGKIYGSDSRSTLNITGNDSMSYRNSNQSRTYSDDTGRRIGHQRHTSDGQELRRGLHSKNEGSITFLYKIVHGVAHSSWGFNCALRAGIPANIVDRAKEICKPLRDGLPVSPNRQLSHVLAAAYQAARVDFPAAPDDAHIEHLVETPYDNTVIAIWNHAVALCKIIKVLLSKGVNSRGQRLLSYSDNHDDEIGIMENVGEEKGLNVDPWGIGIAPSTATFTTATAHPLQNEEEEEERLQYEDTNMNEMQSKTFDEVMEEFMKMVDRGIKDTINTTTTNSAENTTGSSHSYDETQDS